VAAFIDDPHRFPHSKTVGRYFGLVPSQDQSGDRNRLGHIAREGAPVVRLLVALASWQAIRRSLGFSTVWVRQPTGSAILASVHAGPSTSAFSRISARRTFWEEPLRYLTTYISVARSTSARRTIYFFRMVEPSVVTAILS
jgi:hypothetical protein